jgi:hypothetical protein
MKLKHIILMLLVSLIFVNCKIDKNNSEIEKQKQNEAVQQNLFKVSINAIVSKTDDFCLLYSEDGSINFKDGVWQQVLGSSNEQTINFYLPEGVFPSLLRLDLGKKTEQDTIVLKSMTFSYQGKVRELVGPQIGVFFRPDVNKCTFDASTGIVKAIEKDGVKQSPSLYPHESIQSVELVKLAK